MRFQLMRPYSIILCGMFVLGCYKGETPMERAGSFPPKEGSESDKRQGGNKLDSRVGKRVTFEGLAVDAKQGALIKGEDFAVYVDQLDSWPADILGRKVRATGTLVKRKIAPDPVVNQSGGVSAGAFGEPYLIEDAKWEVVNEGEKGVR